MPAIAPPESPLPAVSVGTRDSVPVGSRDSATETVTEGIEEEAPVGSARDGGVAVFDSTGCSDGELVGEVEEGMRGGLQGIDDLFVMIPICTSLARLNLGPSQKDIPSS
mmetsp:Transcript_16765/g.34551  ORF Transcript_16765/g.34551 Transcript_16765/m.34551 type:complete len:109 (-) Transcript_16765:1743-2069(-)